MPLRRQETEVQEFRQMPLRRQETEVQEFRHYH